MKTRIPTSPLDARRRLQHARKMVKKPESWFGKFYDACLDNHTLPKLSLERVRKIIAQKKPGGVYRLKNKAAGGVKSAPPNVVKRGQKHNQNTCPKIFNDPILLIRNF